jgi:hypothetical protein
MRKDTASHLGLIAKSAPSRYVNSYPSTPYHANGEGALDRRPTFTVPQNSGKSSSLLLAIPGFDSHGSTFEREQRNQTTCL